MSDMVVGVAVLDAEAGELYIRCRKACGEVFDTCIPVYPEGQPKTREHQWHYRIVGDTLHLGPSVNMPGRPFHNAASWSVRFVKHAKDDPAYAEHPHMQLRDANIPPHDRRLHD